jgi:hypothetical protein
MIVTCQLIVLVRRETVWQVPLTDDGSCEGGLLLFACEDGRLMHVQRRVGSILAHDGDAVHGVTRLVKGVRCRLQRAGTAVMQTANCCSLCCERPCFISHVLCLPPGMACTLFAGDRQRHTCCLPPTSRTMWRDLGCIAMHHQTGCRCKSVTRAFLHSANGGDDYFVLCLLWLSRRLLSSSHFECSSVQRAIDAACFARSRCQVVEHDPPLLLLDFFIRFRYS